MTKEVLREKYPKFAKWISSDPDPNCERCEGKGEFVYPWLQRESPCSCVKMIKCDVCKIDNPEMVMIKNDLWDSIAAKKDFLCVACIELKLGRKITKDDLIPCWITKQLKLGFEIFSRGKEAS